jgi:hypothetical protein
MCRSVRYAAAASIQACGSEPASAGVHSPLRHPESWRERPRAKNARQSAEPRRALAKLLLQIAGEHRDAQTF